MLSGFAGGDDAMGQTMSASDEIDFWFTVGSTYTYLTVNRLASVEAATGVRFRWRPYNAREIMQEMNNVPFATKPIKLAYMWRDLQRRAALYGIPINAPAPYPLTEFDLASRVAVLAAKEGWCPAYVRASYRRWFIDGHPAGSEPIFRKALPKPDRIPRELFRWQSPTRSGMPTPATDEARRLGIFGAPTFVTRGELFWGDDRLDDALAWHAQGKLAPHRLGKSLAAE